MTDRLIDEIELERYELNEGAAYRFEMHRRDFFKTLGGGILIAFTIKDALAVQESGGGGRRQGESLPKEIGAWLHIGEDGTATAYTGKVEFGQGIRTSLAQAVAEELRVPLAAVRLVMGDTELTPFDMGTFGSRTTPTMNPQLRKAAAAAREVLLGLAAERLKVEPGSLTIVEGRVLHPPTKRSLGFGELSRDQRLLKTVADDVPLTPPARWKVAGQSAPKVGGREVVTGKHQYTSDMKLPGMLYGKVLRPESFGATLASFDAREAEKIEGVIVVRDGDFAGVAARRQPVASRAVSALRAKWKTTPQISTRELYDHLKKRPSAGEGNEGGEGRSNYTRGSIAEGMAAANRKLERAYTVAYIAHAPLEPRAAVAEWKDGKLTVWTGTQRPFGVREELADAFHIPQTKIRVIVPDTGSGYGGKHTGEVALEAARLAKAAGKPVKVTWSREEEFTWAYFRPAGVIEIKSGVNKDGVITAWEFHNYNSGPSGIRTVYDIANQQIEFHSTQSPLRQGSYRGLAATANHFAREVHIDELAESLKIDPLEFRLGNLKDERMRAALQAAAKRFGWGKATRAKDRGFGIACGFEKGGYVASCAEVSVDRAGGKVKLERVVTVFECGAIVNPDGLKHQVEGAVIQSIGGAMFEAIEFENGRILNSRFSRYRLPRFSDIPVLETVLLDRKDLPSAGAGETPIVGLAPAVSNAIFSATGIRLRSLPMIPESLKKEINSEEIKSK